MSGRALGRERTAPPARIVHLGLGAFGRAHQAWYTDQAPDAGAWGIVGFSGRRTGVVDALRAQDGLYTLTTRRTSTSGDEALTSLVASVVGAHVGTDHDAWIATMAAPATALVTVTVTEAGWHTGADGRLAVGDPAIAADVDALRADRRAPVATAPARLAAGLAARLDAGCERLAIVPCDNLLTNGTMARTVIVDLAGAVDAGLGAAVGEALVVVDTMVDRITPRPTDALAADVERTTGLVDRAPVLTEPFSEWVLAGDFPSGRPDWAAAGATFTDDVAPHEQRKLALLNGAHSLLAYLGSVRGHDTVADTLADDECRAAVEAWWDEAAPHVPPGAGDLDAYRAALVDRFANAAIVHRLAQIAEDGSRKLPVRVLPTVRAERTAGRLPSAAVTVLAAWLVHLRGRARRSATPTLRRSWWRRAARCRGRVAGSWPESPRTWAVTTISSRRSPSGRPASSAPDPADAAAQRPVAVRGPASRRARCSDGLWPYRRLNAVLNVNGLW